MENSSQYSIYDGEQNPLHFDLLLPLRENKTVHSPNYHAIASLHTPLILLQKDVSSMNDGFLEFQYSEK